MQQITLLEVARQKGVHLTPNQLRTVGDKAARFYTQLTGTKPEKVPQTENGELIQVNGYPQEYEPILVNMLTEAIQVSSPQSV